MSSESREFEGELSAGQMLGRYELLLPIGRGGMGKVWAARLKGARGFRKLVAVKTILNVKDARLSQMLLDEATLASQIQHPNVAETIELGEHDGKLYSVMELVDGESLSVILREARGRGGVPLRVGVNLAAQVCRGLQAAHDLTDRHGNRVGLVHRDVSPPNVLVTFSGVAKIIDFGVATTSSSRDSDPEEVRGKVSYFAPEQLRAQVVDARVDVFAAGILLYLLTTERHPFRGNSEEETVRRIVSPALAPQPSSFLEDYPEALEEVLLRALEKDRDRRYPSAVAFLDALEQALPSAFGPAGDRLTAEYVRMLLAERMLERRRLIRAAEDFSESSSPCASVFSVPAVAHSAPSAPRYHSPSRIGSLALLVLSVMLAFAMVNRQRLWPRGALASAVTSPGAVVLAAREAGTQRAVAGPAPLGSRVLEHTPPVASASLAATSASALRPVAARAGAAGKAGGSGEAPSLSELLERPHSALAPPSPLARPAERVAFEDRSVLAIGSGLEATAAVQVTQKQVVEHGLLAPAPATALPPPSAKPRSQKQVGSRVGHAQLLIDPHAAPYRVEVPAILQRAGQSASAAISICVGVGGNVIGAKVQSLVGPELGPRIVSAVSRWKYRPLLDGGQAVPFCYLLRYQFSGR